MGSFADYSVSVITFEIVRLFFNGFFFWCCNLMDCFFWTFFSTPEDLVQFALHIPFNFSSASKLPGCHFFLSRPCLLFRWPEDFFRYDQPEAVSFFLCLKKTCDVWRRLVMPEEAFHTRRHHPQRRHQDSCLVAPRTPIWPSRTHFAWQTKLWLSEDVSVRFNQNLLKQCTHKYCIRLLG